jgi:GTP-binding protein
MSKGRDGAHVTFLLSAYARAQWPEEDAPEVAFVGRSNVGKSSCLNTLVGRKGVARVSKTPGRTQAINFFDVAREGRRMRFADVPGYGFAKVPRWVQVQWEEMVSTYLAERRSLELAVVLVDLRRDPTELDEHMIRWLADAGVPALVVLTKADKIGKNKRVAHQAAICRGLGVARDDSLLFSSLSGDGRAQLWERILAAADGGDPGAGFEG